MFHLQAAFSTDPEAQAFARAVRAQVRTESVAKVVEQEGSFFVAWSCHTASVMALLAGEAFECGAITVVNTKTGITLFQDR